MSDAPEQAPEADASARRGFAVMALVGALASGFIWWSNDQLECGVDKNFCVRVDAERNVLVSTNINAVNGLNRVLSVRGEIALEDGTIHPLTVVSRSEDDWGRSIEVSTTSISNVSVTSMTSPLKVDLKYRIPDLSEAIGQMANLKISGDVLFPYIGNDNVVDRTLRTTGNRFEERTRPFKVEFKALLKPNDFKEEKPISTGWYWLTGIVFALGLFGYIGSRQEDSA